MKAFHLSLIIFMGLFLFSCSEKQNNESASHDHTESSQVYYTCPMHPQIKEDGPGKCPICHMNLTRVEKDEEDEQSDQSSGEKTSESSSKEKWFCEDYPEVTSPTPGPCPIDGTQMIERKSEEKAREVVARVRLNKSRRSHFKSEVFEVSQMKMSKSIHLLGQVLQSEERESNITARIEGRVEKVYISSSGVFIKTNDPVVDIYSPKLITAGEEYLLAKRSHQRQKTNESKKMLEQAKEKLRLWGIKSFQWEEWEQAGEVPRQVTIYSPSSGIVSERNAVKGRYFKEGESLFDLVDLSRVWVELDVYENDSTLVHMGQKATLQFGARPEKQWEGEIDFVSPIIDPSTRTLKIRTTIDNDEGLLLPGMVADARIRIEKQGMGLVIPRSAVIDTGRRKVVWVEYEKNRYQARVIETGFTSRGYSEVLHGLKEGEKVVIEGQFLLDAQAQLFGGYEEESSNAHQH